MGALPGWPAPTMARSTCSCGCPSQLGGPGGGTNPEQLFAAGFAACFHGALSLLAARANVAIEDAEVVAKVTFGRDPVDGLFALTAEIRIRLPGVDRAIAEELVRNTERICPYAKMARTGIDCVVETDGFHPVTERL